MSKSVNSYPMLENLFNSKLRVKVLKFLFRSHPIFIGPRELAKRIQEPFPFIAKEIRDLERIGLIKKTNAKK